MDNKTKVLESFQKAGKPMKNGEIAAETGIDSKEVGKLVKELVAEGKLHSPKRCFYAPVA